MAATTSTISEIEDFQQNELDNKFLSAHQKILDARNQSDAFFVDLTNESSAEFIEANKPPANIGIEGAFEAAYDDDKEQVYYKIGRVEKELNREHDFLSNRVKKLIHEVKHNKHFSLEDLKQSMTSIGNAADRAVDKSLDKLAAALHMDRQELKDKANKTVTIAYKLATAPATFRVIGVLGAMTATTPVLVISATFAAVGFAVDAIRVHSLRSHKKECESLIKYRNSKSKLDHLKKQNPDISELLENDLQDFTRTEEQKNARMYDIKGDETTFYTAFAEAALKQAQVVISAGTKLLSGPSIVSAVMFLKHLTTTQKVYNTHKQFCDFEQDMKKTINDENAVIDAVGYEDLQELAEKTRAMIIQSEAFESTIKIAEERGLNSKEHSDEIKNVFEGEKQRFTAQMKEVKNTHGVVANAKSAVKSLRKSIDPFSKYADLKKLEKKRGNFDEYTKQAREEVKEVAPTPVKQEKAQEVKVEEVGVKQEKKPKKDSVDIQAPTVTSKTKKLEKEREGKRKSGKGKQEIGM